VCFAFQKEQERLADISRQIILERDARVRAQVEEKKAKKAIEILENRAKAEKRIKVGGLGWAVISLLVFHCSYMPKAE